MEKDEIIVRNAVMHILDTTIGMPVFSEYLLELGPDLNDLIRGQIYKIAASDDMKKCTFNEDMHMNSDEQIDENQEEQSEELQDANQTSVFQMIKTFEEENMVEASKEISQRLYEIMSHNVDIPAADVLFATYQINSTLHLAILKLNYKESFMHLTGCDEEGSNYNHIIKQKATLPSVGTKLTEAVLINMSDYSVKIVEKKYEVNGVKTNYLSELFLKCSTQMSQKSRINIVTKAVEQINKEYFEEDFDKHLETKSIIQNEIVEQGSLNVQVISEKIYGDVPEIKGKFEEKLEKYHMATAEVKPQSESTVKKFQKQYITTDTGIEINIPMEQYNDKNNVEFITNVDGTISIVIKNIGRIITK